MFIENEAGSNIKHHYDEDTLILERTETVGAPYPYPYGFIPRTLAPDGDAADCFVVTTQILRSGESVECEPLALLEQSEAGDVDHNLIAVPVGRETPDLEAVSAAITTFAQTFRRDDPTVEVVIGALLDSSHAAAYISECASAHKAGVER